MPDPNTEPAQRDESDVEYTRFKANVQLGDGVDQRGDVTVELVREVPADEQRRMTRVELPGPGDEVQVVGGVPSNDRQFAEFYNELDRATAALRNALGLTPEDDDA